MAATAMAVTDGRRKTLTQWRAALWGKQTGRAGGRAATCERRGGGVGGNHGAEAAF